MNFQRLDRFLQELNRRGVPALDLAVMLDGRVVYRRQEGVRDLSTGEPLRGDELYYLYSATKPVTCAAALTLYEEGGFLLGDPVSDYLPEYADVRVRVRRPDGQEELEKPARPITMRHLFTMTSGLDYALDTPEILSAVEDTQGRAPTRAIARAIARRPLCFQPGEHFRYGLSHDVLAAAVEVISGKRFQDFVQQRVLGPCGMTRTRFHLRAEDRPFLASQYEYDESARICRPTDNENHMILGPEHDSGGAGLISCVEDYLRFERMMLNGGVGENGARVLSPRTIELMRTNHLGPVQQRDFDWPHLLGYGYGLGVRTMTCRTLSGSTGPVGEFGWSGMAGAYVLMDPENRLAAFYAQHMLNNQEPFSHPRLRNILYSLL